MRRRCRVGGLTLLKSSEHREVPAVKASDYRPINPRRLALGFELTIHLVVLRTTKNRPKAVHCISLGGREKLERAKGFEPSTPTLARLCSTPELHPRSTACAVARPLICPKSIHIARAFRQEPFGKSLSARAFR